MYRQEVIVLSSRWKTNCYLLTSSTSDGAEETIIIDPGDEPERIIERIRREELNVVAAVATHAHNDHIGAMKELRDQLHIPIMIHADDVEMAANPKISGFDDEPGRENYAVTKWNRLLHEADAIKWGSDVLRVLHTPGHTRGAICLLDSTNARIFTGDTLFAGTIGRTDFLQGDSEAMRSTCHRLSELPPELAVFPGHGESTTLAKELRHNLPFLSMAEEDMSAQPSGSSSQARG